MGKPHTSSRRLAAVLVLLAVLSGGCRADLAVDLDLAADGSGRFAVALTADAELRERSAGAAGGDPLDVLARAGEDLPGWSATDDATDGGERTITLTAAFDDAEELASLTAAFADGLAGPELAPLSGLRLDVEEDVLRLRGEASLAPEGELPDLGIDAEAATEQALEADALGLTVSVDVPGAVLESDADAVDEEQRTAVWRLEPGESRAITLVAERPAAPVWPLVAGALLGALAALALVVRLRRRRAVP